MRSLNRYVSQTSYMLFLTLPMSIIGFTLTVTFTLLGLVLSPLWIGLPLLHAAIRASHGMMRFDLSLQRELLAPAVIEGRPEPALLAPFRFRDMFTQPSLYAPVLYWTLKLPLAVFQFAFAVIFPLCGACIVLSPVVYIVLAQYGIEIFNDDIVMNVLLPAFTAYQRSLVASGIGLIMLLIGIAVLNGFAKASVRLLNGLGIAAAPPVQASAVTAMDNTAPTSSSYPPIESYMYNKEEAFSG